jgi:hypothetical protein
MTPKHYATNSAPACHPSRRLFRRHCVVLWQAYGVAVVQLAVVLLRAVVLLLLAGYRVGR